MTRPMTFFIDLDGTVFYHQQLGQADQTRAQPISGAKEMIDELLKRGHFIVLTTGRRSHLREATIKQLDKACIAYDELIMDLPSGSRIVVNDRKPENTITAHAVSHKRNTVEWGATCLDLSSREEQPLSPEVDEALFG